MDLTVFEAFARHVSLHGNEVRMSCPFHKGGREEHPSFAINIETQMWNCLACHERGNGLLSLLLRVGYEQEYAIKMCLGVASGEPDVDPVEASPPSQVYERDVAFAREMYEGVEDWSVPSPERGYLFERNFMRATLERWRVRILSGVRTKTIFIPLFFHGFIGDEYQEIVYGWQRRSPNKWEKPKYLTMPKLHRGQYLYGHFGHGKMVLVCEGVTDAWMASQRGVRNVVATLGSYPSREQWALLERAEAIICGYHNDQPGLQGYEVFKKFCGPQRFLHRLNLSTDLADSRLDQFEKAWQEALYSYQIWKKLDRSLLAERSIR